MDKYTVHVIPAKPGWKHGLFIDETSEMEWTDIIAWKVGIKSDDPDICFVEPLTPLDNESCTNKQVIMHPDGVTVDIKHDRRFANVLEVIEYLKPTKE